MLRLATNGTISGTEEEGREAAAATRASNLYWVTPDRYVTFGNMTCKQHIVEE